MAVRKGPSADEVFGSFAARLEETARLPNIYRYEPMPQQELFHKSTTKGRILFGGNRGGKTFGGVADDVLILTHRHPHRNHLYAQGPIRMRFIGVDFDRGIKQGAIPIFQQLIPPSFLINGNWLDSYRDGDHMLTLSDKSTVSFMSYEQQANKFQIVSLHHIHFDEEPPKPVFDESMLRLVDTAGSWTLSETPVQQLEWVQDELMEPVESGARTDIEIFYLSTLDNTNLPVDELMALEQTMSEEEKIVRLEGRYKGGSLVFPEFERKWPFVIPEEAFTLTDEHTVYASMDYGYANPTAWAYTAVHPDGSIVTFKLLYGASIVISEWAKAVHEMNRRIGMSLGLSEVNAWRPHVYIGDPSIKNRTDGQSGITNQQAYSLAGIPISVEGITKARAQDQNVGLNKMHTYLRLRPASHPDRPGEPWWQLTDNCTAAIDEIKRARKPRQTLANKEVKNQSEEIRDKDNHAIDALKYLFMMAHDLRPPQYRELTEQLSPELLELMNPVHTQAATHQQAYKATMSDTGSGWEVHDAYGSNYSTLED